MAFVPINTQKIGRFLVQESLGRGTSGRVWRARDEHTGENVALKIVPREHAFSLGREFDALARVRHPSLPRALDLIFVTEANAALRTNIGDVVLVEELIDGLSTLDALRNIDDVALERTCAGYAFAMLSALEALHAAGLTHGDVHADNILVAKNGNVVLVDLGAVAPFGLERTVSGTPTHLAPEAWRGTRNARTDLYALGVTMREWAARRRIAEHTSLSLDTLVNDGFDLGASLPIPAVLTPAFVEFAKKLCAREASARPQNAESAERELRHALHLTTAADAFESSPKFRYRARLSGLPWIGNEAQIEAFLATLTGEGKVLRVREEERSGAHEAFVEASRRHIERALSRGIVPLRFGVVETLSDAAAQDFDVIFLSTEASLPDADTFVDAARIAGRQVYVCQLTSSPKEDDLVFARWTKSELAHAIGFVDGNDGTRPSDETLERVARACGFSRSHFVALAAAISDADKTFSTFEFGATSAHEHRATASNLSTEGRRIHVALSVADGELLLVEVAKLCGSAARAAAVVRELCDVGAAIETHDQRVCLMWASAPAAHAIAKEVLAAASSLRTEAFAQLALDHGSNAVVAERFAAAIAFDVERGLANNGLALAKRAVRFGVRSVAFDSAAIDAALRAGDYAFCDTFADGPTPSQRLRLADACRARGDRERALSLLATDDTADCAAVRARVLFDAADYEGARVALQHAVAATTDSFATARAEEVHALLGLVEGDLPRVTVAAAKLYELSRPDGAKVWESRAYEFRARVARSMHRYDEAAALHRHASESASNCGEIHASLVFAVNAALADLDAGELGEAVRGLEHAARGLSALSRGVDARMTAYNLANARHLIGDDDGARLCADAVERSGLAQNDVVDAHFTLLRAELAKGREERVAQLARLKDIGEGAAAAALSARASLCAAQVGDVQLAEFWLAIASAHRADPSGIELARAGLLVAQKRPLLGLESVRRVWEQISATAPFEMRLNVALLCATAATDAFADAWRLHFLGIARTLLDQASRTLSRDALARLRSTPRYARAFAATPERATTRVEADVDQDDARWRKLALLAEKIAKESSSRGVARALVQGAVELVGAERALLLASDADGTWRVLAADSVAERFASLDEIVFSQSIVKRAAISGKTASFVDAELDPKLSLAASVHALKLRSVAVVPLQARGGDNYALYADDRLRPGAFDAADLAVLEHLGVIGALVLVSANRVADAQREVVRVRAEQKKVERRADVERRELAQLRRLLGKHPELTGSSRAWLRVVEQIEKFGEADVPLLVRGESGTGKELVARALHRVSPRRALPLISENCAAIPDALLESTLFGHVKGAFTGADKDRRGLFERANGGTLFLDEIGEMSASMQSKLLRVLQEGEFLPVGGERVRRVNVRVIAATHRDLQAMIDEGKFRQDLYFRLAVVTMSLPPLRERPEDIAELSDVLLARFAEGRRMTLHPDTLRILESRPWPGNIRELENVLRRAAILASDIIMPAHIEAMVDAATTSNGDPLDLRSQVNALERRLIDQAFAVTRGNQTQAARLLGLSRVGLRKMMTRLSAFEADATAPLKRPRGK